MADAAEEAPKVRKRVNGRAKGASFERDVATTLRGWLGPRWEVTRNPTDRQKGQAGCSGEFGVLDREKGEPFPFVIECKARESFDEAHLFSAIPVGAVHAWWKQACAQASAVGSRPMMIVKRNMGAVLVVVQPGVLPGGFWPALRTYLNGQPVHVAPLDRVTGLDPSVLGVPTDLGLIVRGLPGVPPPPVPR